METTGSQPRKALDGVRVLDLSQFESGPVVSMMLAWLGAEVVKIEEPSQGDQGRYASANLPGVDSFYFLMLNCNKRSATLNLRDTRGKEMLRRMIGKADVFLENFAPGTIERMGFSYEEVSALNPRIIYAQIKGYGTGSPYARYLAFDMTVQAMGGSMSITGTPDTMPLRPGPTIADTGSGMNCVVGILAALYQRVFTGRGQRVEVAMQDTVVNFCRIAYASQQLLGHATLRVGNQNPLRTQAPSNTYPCKPLGPNDYVFIYPGRAGNKLWDRLLQVMGRTDLRDDPRFVDNDARVANEAELDRMIGEWTGQYTKHEALRILGEAGVPAGAVLDTEELSGDAYLRDRGTFVALDHPYQGEFVVPGCPVKLSESPVQVVRPPLLGEQTAEVYREWLGLDEAQIERLRAEKVV